MKTPEKIKVLIVGPALPLVGGQSIQASRLLEKIKSDEILDAGFVAINPKFLPSLQKIKYLRTIVTTVAYVFHLLRQIPRYQIIHIFSASFWSFLIAPAPAVIIAKIFGKKVLLNYHSGFAEEHLREWPRTALPLIRRCDLVVTPSRYLVDIFAKFGIDAVPVSNFVGIEDFKFRKRKTLRPVFLSNRNFEDLYNVAGTIDAFAAIQAEYPEAELIIAGDGPLKAEIRGQVKRLGLRNVEFAGQVSEKEMAMLYDRTDIYLNASNVDNMPISILEAYSSGTPVVSTDSGGIPYILEHEVSGLLVSKGDSKSLAEQAMRLLKEPELAANIASNAQKEMEKYSWEGIGADWLRIYKELSDRTR